MPGVLSYTNQLTVFSPFINPQQHQVTSLAYSQADHRGLSAMGSHCSTWLSDAPSAKVLPCSFALSSYIVCPSSGGFRNDFVTNTCASDHCTTSVCICGTVDDDAYDVQRHLGNRQIQLIAIGGPIGTAFFISISGALNAGGLLGILIAYTGCSCIIALVSNAMAEVACYMPASGGFIRLAGH